MGTYPAKKTAGRHFGTLRLTQAVHPNIPQESYSYAPLGNRLGSVGDAANRLLDDGIYTYSYDNNGNLTQKTNKTDGSISTYSYDAEDRLTGVNNNITHSYDPLVIGGRVTSEHFA